MPLTKAEEQILDEIAEIMAEEKPPLKKEEQHSGSTAVRTRKINFFNKYGG